MIYINLCQWILLLQIPCICKNFISIYYLFLDFFPHSNIGKGYPISAPCFPNSQSKTTEAFLYDRTNNATFGFCCITKRYTRKIFTKDCPRWVCIAMSIICSNKLINWWTLRTSTICNISSWLKRDFSRYKTLTKFVPNHLWKISKRVIVSPSILKISFKTSFDCPWSWRCRSCSRSSTINMNFLDGFSYK